MKNLNTAADQLAADLKKKLNCDGSYISVKTHDNLYYFGNSEKTLVHSTLRVDKLDETVCKVPIARNALFKATNLSDEIGFSNLPYAQSGRIKGYVGFPIRNYELEPVGAVCLISSSERNWSNEDVTTLKESAEKLGDWLSLRQKSFESRKLSEALLSHDNTLLALANNLDILVSVHDHAGGLLFGTNKLTQSLSIEQIEATVKRGIKKREDLLVRSRKIDSPFEQPVGSFDENPSANLDQEHELDFVWTCRIVSGENGLFYGKWSRQPKKPNSNLVWFRE